MDTSPEPKDGISYFSTDGKGVEKYLNDLKAFSVVMGRKPVNFAIDMHLPGKMH